METPHGGPSRHAYAPPSMPVPHIPPAYQPPPPTPPHPQHQQRHPQQQNQSTSSSSQLGHLVPQHHHHFSQQQSRHLQQQQQQQHQQQQQQQQQQQHQSSDNVDRARAYRARNKRPCDFCRYKRAACHLESRPPCELCQRYGKPCTFKDSPAKRRRNNDSAGGGKQQMKAESAVRHSVSSGNEANTGANAPFVSTVIEPMEDIMQWDNMSHFPMDINSNMPEFPFVTANQLYPEAMPFVEPFDAGQVSSVALDPLQQQLAAQNSRGSMETTTSPLSPTSVLPPSLHVPFDVGSGEPSLDRQQSSNSQLVGLSGESDPYLLSRFRFDENNEAAFQRIRVRKMDNGPSDPKRTVPAFYTIQHNDLANKAQPQDNTDSVEKWRGLIEQMVNEEEGKRLIQLFYKYVQPYYPVLTREGGGERDINGIRDPRDASPCVLAAVYGHALPFRTWDDHLCVDVYQPPSPDVLFKIAWNSCLPALHTPNIAVIQALLLLVQRRPTNTHVSDTPFKWAMMSMCVSVAQVLGLNRDPTDWPIPDWEKRHRKRLAWAVFVQDKWLSLNFGRSSHIQANDWDVPPLTEADFAPADRKVGDRGDGRPNLMCQHFIKLSELTTVVDDIYHNLYSIKATRLLHGSLEMTLDQAKPLHARISDWFLSCPAGLLPFHPASEPPNASQTRYRRRPTRHEPDGHGSLQLAYITAKIELFRAMLRPKTTDTSAAAIAKLRPDARAVAREIHEFLESLKDEELEAFWTSYARTNFTIASSFFVLLFVTSPVLPDAEECLDLLKAWRDLLRVKHRKCDLLGLAWLRLEGLFHAGLDRLVELTPAAQQAWNQAPHTA